MRTVTNRYIMLEAAANLREDFYHLFFLFVKSQGGGTFSLHESLSTTEKECKLCIGAMNAATAPDFSGN